MRNIYNKNDIDDFISLLLDKKSNSSNNIKKWIKSNLKNYLVKEHSDLTAIENVDSVSESWAKDAVISKTLSKVNINIETQSKIEHAIDYLNHTYDDEKDLSRMSITTVIEKSIEWTKNQKKVDDDINGTDIFIEYFDNYKWVQINSEQSIQYEGYAMNHCLGFNYTKDILNGKFKAFSLRDANNKPHITILYNNEKNEISEIKGNSNLAVKSKYQEYVPDFLNNMSFSKIVDFDYIPNIQLSTIDGFYFNPNKTTSNPFFMFKSISLPFIKNSDIKNNGKYLIYNIQQLGNSDNESLQNELIELNINTLDNNSQELFSKIQSKKVNIKKVKKSLVYNEFNLINNHIDRLSINLSSSPSNYIDLIKMDNLELLELKANLLQGQFNIKKIDLSQAKNLSTIKLDNIIVDELILPKSNLKKISIINSTIKSVNDITCNVGFIRESNLNNLNMNFNELHLFKSKVNEKINVSKVFFTDYDNQINCDNVFSTTYTKINAQEKINDLFFYNKKNYNDVDILSLSYDVNSIDDKVLKSKLSIENIIHNTCMSDVSMDLLYILKSYNINFSFDLFKTVYFLDKPMELCFNESDDRDIGINFRKDFLEHKMNDKKEFEQFVLFHFLRFIDYNGFSVDEFKSILKTEIHPNIYKEFDVIQKTPTLYFYTSNKSELDLDKSNFIDKIKNIPLIKFNSQLIFDRLDKAQINDKITSIHKEITNIIYELTKEPFTREKDYSILIKTPSQSFNQKHKESLLYYFDKSFSHITDNSEIAKEVYELIEEKKLYNILSRNDILNFYVLTKNKESNDFLSKLKLK